MGKIQYHIISTGSKGNAVVVNESILIDCGVPYTAIAPFAPKLKLVLLTHIHGDHFRASTIRTLAANRPTLRFACCRWLVTPLVNAGVSAKNIDVLEIGIMYAYGICNVIPVMLAHNVPNCGWKIHFREGKVFYATDTNNLNGITAPNYDLYLVEANFEEKEILQRIADKKEAGEYAYEQQVLKNHLSKAKCDNFIYRNIGTKGEYVHMHCHVESEVEDEREADRSLPRNEPAAAGHH